MTLKLRQSTIQVQLHANSLLQFHHTTRTDDTKLLLPSRVPQTNQVQNILHFEKLFMLMPVNLETREELEENSLLTL